MTLRARAIHSCLCLSLLLTLATLPATAAPVDSQEEPPNWVCHEFVSQAVTPSLQIFKVPLEPVRRFERIEVAVARAPLSARGQLLPFRDALYRRFPTTLDLKQASDTLAEMAAREIGFTNVTAMSLALFYNALEPTPTCFRFVQNSAQAALVSQRSSTAQAGIALIDAFAQGLIKPDALYYVTPMASPSMVWVVPQEKVILGEITYSIRSGRIYRVASTGLGNRIRVEADPLIAFMQDALSGLGKTVETLQNALDPNSSLVFLNLEIGPRFFYEETVSGGIGSPNIPTGYFSHTMLKWEWLQRLLINKFVINLLDLRSSDSWIQKETRSLARWFVLSLAQFGVHGFQCHLLQLGNSGEAFLKETNVWFLPVSALLKDAAPGVIPDLFPFELVEPAMGSFIKKNDEVEKGFAFGSERATLTETRNAQTSHGIRLPTRLG